MNQEETNESQKREGRYRESQDDTKIMRKQLEGISANVGEIMIALKGNDLGSDGLIKRVAAMEKVIKDLTDQLDDITVKADKRLNLLLIICTMGGTFMGFFLKWLTDQFKK